MKNFLIDFLRLIFSLNLVVGAEIDRRKDAEKA